MIKINQSILVSILSCTSFCFSAEAAEDKLLDEQPLLQCPDHVENLIFLPREHPVSIASGLSFDSFAYISDQARPTITFIDVKNTATLEKKNIKISSSWLPCLNFPRYVRLLAGSHSMMLRDSDNKQYEVPPPTPEKSFDAVHHREEDNKLQIKVIRSKEKKGLLAKDLITGDCKEIYSSNDTIRDYALTNDQRCVILLKGQILIKNLQPYSTLYGLLSAANKEIETLEPNKLPHILALVNYLQK